MAYAFMVTPEIEAQCKAAVVEARKNVVPWEKMKDIAIGTPTDTLMLSERKGEHPRMPASLSVDIPVGYRAAISFEEQPAGIFRHMSVSTPRKGEKHLPHPAVIAECCRLFGFTDGLVKLLLQQMAPEHANFVGRIWMEEFEPNHFAVNVIELETSREAGHA